MVADSARADIVVRWIDHFDFDRAGQTDLTWDQPGRVRRAAISLAIRTHTGVALPDPRCSPWRSTRRVTPSVCPIRPTPTT